VPCFSLDSLPLLENVVVVVVVVSVSPPPPFALEREAVSKSEGALYLTITSFLFLSSFCGVASEPAHSTLPNEISMKAVLALCTALLALGPVSGRLGPILTSDVYKATTKTTEVSIQGRSYQARIITIF
jgi:hypothetical protein